MMNRVGRLRRETYGRKQLVIEHLETFDDDDKKAGPWRLNLFQRLQTLILFPRGGGNLPRKPPFGCKARGRATIMEGK